MSSERAAPKRAVRKSRFFTDIIVILGLKDRHLLYLLGVAPTALTKKIIMVTALADCPIRCRTFGAFRRTHVKLVLQLIAFSQ